VRALRFPLLVAVPVMVAASTGIRPSAPQAETALTQARADAATADAEVRRLEELAVRARSEADRLAAEQLAAAQAIAAAESRISAADAEMRLIALRQAGLKQRLAAEQQPVSSLLGGLAVMAQQPPLLALAEARTSEELVEMRVLVDSTLPVIQARTARLRQSLAAGEGLQQAAAQARQRLEDSRSELAMKRQQFAVLESRALAAAASTGAQAVQAGDTALAAAEAAEVLGSTAEQSATASQVAAQLAREPIPPTGPASAGGAAAQAPFPYRLPAEAPVLAGLGAISASGVRSRGVTLGTRRGAAVAAPASGTVRFAGPFRGYDGIVIIDHGRGWLSLVVNVASTARTGDRIVLGAPIGRALGPIDVELSQGGRRLSPALIAGSSARLSKRGEDS
jgi:murein hydrolase activator